MICIFVVDGVTASAAEEQIKVSIGDQVTMRFSVSGLVEYAEVYFMIEPLENITDVSIQVPCNFNESTVLLEGSTVVESSFLCARVSLTFTEVKQETFGRYNLQVFYNGNEEPVIASTDLLQAKTVSKLSVYFLQHSFTQCVTFKCSLKRNWLKIWSA